jgi:phage repressor protein C with HTH and peptisase S24 domain
MSNQVIDGDSVRASREKFGLTQAELAALAGVGFATLGRWERGETVPRPKQARAILDALQRLQDEGSGTGAMHRSLDDLTLIPRVSVEASAGGGLAVQDEQVEHWLAFRRDWLKKRGLAAGQCVAVTVRGDSMRPELLDGDVAFVDRGTTEPTGRDQVFVFRHLDAVLVKRLRRTVGGVLVSSVNPEYHAYTIEAGLEEDFAVLGRVFSVARSYL